MKLAGFKGAMERVLGPLAAVLSGLLAIIAGSSSTDFAALMESALVSDRAKALMGVVTAQMELLLDRDFVLTDLRRAAVVRVDAELTKVVHTAKSYLDKAEWGSAEIQVYMVWRLAAATGLIAVQVLVIMGVVDAKVSLRERCAARASLTCNLPQPPARVGAKTHTYHGAPLYVLAPLRTSKQVSIVFPRPPPSPPPL
jgi:hypothetical protein